MAESPRSASITPSVLVPAARLAVARPGAVARRVAVVAGLAAAITALPLLTGCSLVQQIRPQDGTTFARYESASSRWASDPDIPAWIPSESTDIRTRTTVDRAAEIVRVTTSADPAGECEPADAAALPDLAASWAPDATGEEVYTCGIWTVTDVDSGWFGWRTASAETSSPTAAPETETEAAG